MDITKISQGPNGLYLENFYTSLSEAKEEIWRRWNDRSLRHEIEMFFGGAIPEPLKDYPKAYLPIYLATPDLYTLRFLELAKEIDLKPVCLEYVDDQFCSRNHYKYYLGKLFFYNGKGKHGGAKLSTLKIIDFNKSQGKPLKEINTLWGEGFVCFHHRLLSLIDQYKDMEVSDYSQWYRGIIPNNYIYYLALSICNSVMFDNFLIISDEREFTEEIVLPNFNKLYRMFGLRPLIVPVIPILEECDIYWNCYQDSIKSIVIESLDQVNE